MDIVRAKVVETRKLHNCWGCTKELPIGSKIQAVTSVDDNMINTVYWCDDCREYMDTLESIDTQFGFAYGELHDNYMESIRQEV